MTKAISDFGTSRGIEFDEALMDLAHARPGDEYNVAVQDGGTIVLTPVRRAISVEEVKQMADEIIRMNDELFRRLA